MVVAIITTATTTAMQLYGFFFITQSLFMNKKVELSDENLRTYLSQPGQTIIALMRRFNKERIKSNKARVSPRTRHNLTTCLWMPLQSVPSLSCYATAIGTSIPPLSVSRCSPHPCFISYRTARKTT